MYYRKYLKAPCKAKYILPVSDFFICTSQPTRQILSAHKIVISFYLMEHKSNLHRIKAGGGNKCISIKICIKMFNLPTGQFLGLTQFPSGCEQMLICIFDLIDTLPLVRNISSLLELSLLPHDFLHPDFRVSQCMGGY